MKKISKISLLCLAVLMVALTGCTAEEPGYVIITGNPEVQVVDSDGNIIHIDEETGAIIALTYDHQLLHDGVAFKSDTVDETLGDGENITIVFKTMLAPKRAHIFFEFSTLVGGDIRIWEDVTWTTGTGGLLPIVNRKREVSMVDSGVLEDLTASPLFTATNNVLEGVGGLNIAGATTIYHIYAWGRKEKVLAGRVRQTEGFLLKPDTQYAAVFTADGAANKAQVILNWLEETHNE